MLNGKMKPMKAVHVEVAEIRYPLLASAKLDGIRGVVINGALRSNTLKPIPNPYTSALFSRPELSGYDGELIVGDPHAFDVCRMTTGAMARHDGEPDVLFYVFDRFDVPGGFAKRNAMLKASDRVVVLEQRLIHNEAELLAFEDEMLELGYEGLILRDPEGEYKFGRSTVREGWMLKLKRFTDSEAEIIAVEEEFENTNAKVTNALGRGQRSSHKAGMVPKGRAGALVGRDIHTGLPVKMGSGLNAEDRDFYWKHRNEVAGKIVKYKSFGHGVKDKARHAIYLCPREAWDIS